MTQPVKLGPEYYPDPTIGRPISSGYVYVGEVDLDPEVVANQIQVSVLQEDGTETPVTQPIRTGAGGVPIYNGSYVTLLVDEESYSLKVLDQFGSQVYYVPESFGVQGPSYSTDDFELFDPIDNTKKIVFDASNISTGTTRTVTVPDRNVTIGDPTLYEVLNTSGFQSQWSKGADVASAAALPILTDGNSFDVTGTTAITSINTTGRIGTWIMLQFDGILTLTHHANDLILPGAANITTAAGDLALCYEYASGDWRVLYQKASGEPIVSTDSITLGTPVATTSGTSVDITSIPSGTKRVTLMFDQVSTNGASEWLVQLGDSGGIETTGYRGSGMLNGTSALNTAGFLIRNADAAGVINGSLSINLFDLSTFTYACSGSTSNSNTADVFVTPGTKDLTAELTQLRLTTIGGANTFDNGKIVISYEK